MKFLKYITLFVLAFFATAFTSSAQDSTLENSLLWKIEGKGIKTSYLFGTIHLLSKEKFIMPPKVKSAFLSAEELVLEVDFSNDSVVMGVMNYAFLPKGTTLKSLMTPEEYHQLDSALLAISGMGLTALNNYKPIVIESMFLQSYVGNESVSYEFEFSHMAEQQKIQIVGLETAAQQMMLFDELPMDEQIQDLMNYALGKGDMAELFDEMVEMYLSENINQLDYFMTDYYPDTTWLEPLLYQRNAAWIPKIETEAAQKSVFIAVGAGHLGGEKGLIALLRKAGYTVEAVH